MTTLTHPVEKVVIIGSGPAGHTAAIYAARANLEPLMFEGFLAGGVAAGGQLTTTTEVENYPGFPEGVDGTKLMDLMRAQSERFGTRIFTETVEKVGLGSRPFTITTAEREVHASSIILATGATAKRLHVKGEERLWQCGISACAVCDGALPLFRHKPLVVVGGGDTAVEEATFLTKFGSTVHVVHRRHELRGTREDLVRRRGADLRPEHGHERKMSVRLEHAAERRERHLERKHLGPPIAGQRRRKGKPQEEPEPGVQPRIAPAPPVHRRPDHGD